MLSVPKIVPIVVEYKGNQFTAFASQVEAQMQILVDKYLGLIAALAQSYISVDQAVAKASIFTASTTHNNHDEAYAKARVLGLTEESKWQHKGRRVEFADDPPELHDLQRLFGIIAVGVIYGMWLEMGDYNIAQPNQPGAQAPYLSKAMKNTNDFPRCR